MKAIVFVFLLIPITSSFSQTCCSGGIPLSNSIGTPMQEAKSFQVRLHYDYNYLNTLNNGSKNLNDDSRLRVTHSILLNLNYSFTKNISIEGLFSWVNQRRKITQFNTQSLTQSSGIGDSVLLLKYALLNSLGKNSTVNFGLGSKIPTGSSTQKNEQNILLNADLQPGSSAWDFIFWSLVSKQFNFRPTLNFSSSFTYRKTGTNSNYLDEFNYRFGNELQTSFSISDQYLFFDTLINPSITIKYRNASRDKINNVKIENTGGNWLFISSDVKINLLENIAFSFSIDLPIHSNVNGTQLTPTYRINTGIIFLFKPKESIQL
ncbi:transporter [Pontimicrobium sp. IMCC45349]|uniref:transporter n=1 Tax=Pontimicrobium sp. IMCC45349 TaxID=3391574 RepID=UPI00399F7376